MKSTVYIFTIILLFFLQVIALAESRPDWVDGKSLSYPGDRYLTGVGYDAVREMAEKKAFVAMSNIFSANIASVSKDYEKYSQVTSTEKEAMRNEVNIEQVIRITTDKVLENVTVVETWFDDNEKVYYILSVIDRAKAGNSLKEKINSLDSQIQEMINENETTDKILKIRNLRGAIKKLIQREIYNADLRVINLSGQGIECSFNIAVLNNELSSFLKNNFAIYVEVRGERGDDIKIAIVEGLNKQGFSVAETAGDEDVIVQGEINFAEANVQNQDFKFIRWTADFKLIDKGNDKAIGSISRSEKEGHLSMEEAKGRVIKKMREEIANDISTKLAQFIYGEEDKK